MRQKQMYDNETILVPEGEALYQVNTQLIDEDFLTGIREEQAARRGLVNEGWAKAVQVPAFVIDLWRQRDGLDFLTMSVKEVCKKLRREGLEAFIVTEKSV